MSAGANDQPIRQPVMAYVLETPFTMIVRSIRPGRTAIIKRLGERGILKNENGLVTALVSRDEAQACEIDELVEKKFEGSLPTFIAAFTRRQDLSDRELDEVQQMIDRIRRGETR